MHISKRSWPGSTNPARLATLCSPRIKAAQETMAREQHGNWREELLFSLRVALDSFHFAQGKIAECDARITEHLAQSANRAVLELPRPPASRASFIGSVEWTWRKPRHRGADRSNRCI